MLLGATGLTQGEEVFFNELRRHADIRSPRAYYEGSEPNHCRSIVLLDDLAHEGWAFPEPMTNSVSEDDARDMVEQMALYHGTFWDSRTAPQARARLQTPLAVQKRLNRVALFPRRVRLGLKRARDLAPSSIWRRRDELWPAVMNSLHRSGEEGPQTLLHHDVHLGNWLRDPHGRMGLYDWQVLCRGHWAIDVSYTLIVGLAIDDRRNWEQDLLQHYLKTLTDQAVPSVPTHAQAMHEYRKHPMHAYAFGVFTNGQPWYLPELQPSNYTRQSIERILVALGDLDTLNEWRR